MNPNTDRDERVRQAPERIWIDARIITTPSMRVLYGEPPPDGVNSVEYVRAEPLDGQAAGAWPQWSKEAPTVDGVYWWRADEHDSDPDVHLVQGEFFYQVGFGSSEFVKNFGGEWLGPITPTSTNDAATRMRDACIAKVRERRDKFQTAANSSSLPNDLTASRDAAVAAELTRLLGEIQSLTLDQEQEKQKS